MRGELKRLQQELGITFVHVTHSQEEAMALADLVVVMNEGRIEQSGPPRDVYNRPHTVFVARFIGGHNVLTGRVRDVDDRGAVLLGPGEARFEVPGVSAAPEASVSFAVRTDKIAISAPGQGSAANGNLLPTTVASIEYQGAWVLVGLEAPEVEEFTVSLHESSYFEHPVSVGDDVTATWDAIDSHVLT